jgi:hypothetical protein
MKYDKIPLYENVSHPPVLDGYRLFHFDSSNSSFSLSHRFMYNGEVHIGQEQLSDFLKTAHLLQIRGLAEVTNSHHSLHKSNLSHNASLNPASILPALTASLSKEIRHSPVSRIGHCRNMPQLT